MLGMVEPSPTQRLKILVKLLMGWGSMPSDEASTAHLGRLSLPAVFELPESDGLVLSLVLPAVACGL